MEIPPAITPPPPVPRAGGSDKIWSMFCHLSIFTVLGAILVPLVIYLAMKDESEFVRSNAREALNFHLSMVVYGFCCWLLCLVFIGILLLPALGIFILIMAIVATIKASEGGCYNYPLTIRLVQ